MPEPSLTGNARVLEAFFFFPLFFDLSFIQSVFFKREVSKDCGSWDDIQQGNQTYAILRYGSTLLYSFTSSFVSGTKRVPSSVCLLQPYRGRLSWSRAKLALEPFAFSSFPRSHCLRAGETVYLFISVHRNNKQTRCSSLT